LNSATTAEIKLLLHSKEIQPNYFNHNIH